MQNQCIVLVLLTQQIYLHEKIECLSTLLAALAQEPNKLFCQRKHYS